MSPCPPQQPEEAGSGVGSGVAGALSASRDQVAGGRRKGPMPLATFCPLEDLHNLHPRPARLIAELPLGGACGWRLVARAQAPELDGGTYPLAVQAECA